MTEREFLAWSDELIRAEWVNGEAIVRPWSTLQHNDILNRLHLMVSLFVESKKLGSVHGPQALVRLPRLRQLRLPDLLFVAKARASLIRPDRLEGAPDVVCEVVSSDSVARDWREKYLDYERAGVREYWVIDPQSERVEAYHLGRGRKYKRIAEADGKIASVVLEGFSLRPRWVVGPRLPKIGAMLREAGLNFGGGSV